MTTKTERKMKTAQNLLQVMFTKMLTYSVKVVMVFSLTEILRK